MSNYSLGITFPALLVSQDLVQSVDSLDRITQCTGLALKREFYNGLMLIDSKGIKYQVVGAQRVRILPPKANFGSMLAYITGNPRLQVNLVFADEPLVELSLNDVKQLFVDSFQKEKHSWEAMIDFDEFREKIERATSLEGIFSLCKEYRV